MDMEVEERPGREHRERLLTMRSGKPGSLDASLSRMPMLRTFAFSHKL